MSMVIRLSEYDIDTCFEYERIGSRCVGPGCIGSALWSLCGKTQILMLAVDPSIYLYICRTYFSSWIQIRKWIFNFFSWCHGTGFGYLWSLKNEHGPRDTMVSGPDSIYIPNDGLENWKPNSTQRSLSRVTYGESRVFNPTQFDLLTQWHAETR